MNERIRQLAVESHLLNYIDNETPRRYFVSGSAEEDEVHLFALKIIRECAEVLQDNELGGYRVEHVLKEHFGVE
jgi:hypothetical protein